MKKFLLLLLFSTSALFAQGEIENLKIHWPEEYQWKIGNSQEDDRVHFVELVPEKESIDNWTILGTMMSLKGVTGTPMEKIVELFYQQTKEKANDAKLTIIEKGQNAGLDFVLFTLEASSYKNGHKAESQLYYIIQGKSSLYTNFVAIKEKKLKDSFILKWKKIFMESEMVYL